MRCLFRNRLTEPKLKFFKDSDRIKALEQRLIWNQVSMPNPSLTMSPLLMRTALHFRYVTLVHVFLITKGYLVYLDESRGAIRKGSFWWGWERSVSLEQWGLQQTRVALSCLMLSHLAALHFYHRCWSRTVVMMFKYRHTLQYPFTCLQHENQGQGTTNKNFNFKYLRCIQVFKKAFVCCLAILTDLLLAWLTVAL